MGSKRFNRSGYDNEETPQPTPQPPPNDDAGRDNIGSGYLDNAAEAIRKNKAEKARQLKELGY